MKENSDKDRPATSEDIADIQRQLAESANIEGLTIGRMCSNCGSMASVKKGELYECCECGIQS